MRRQEKWYLGLCLGIIFLLSQGVAVWTAHAQAPATSNVFFSQGQAVFNPQEPSKSQREALQDLQIQAVTQAASALLSPAQLGKEYQLIQEKILKQPQRYVQNYQIFSESPGTGGLYRVTGQVTVSMDLLKKDLMALPVTHSERGPAQISTQPAGGPGSSARETELKTHKKGEAAGKTSTRGPEVFWAVAEKWDEGWHLPADGRDPEGPFAASVFQEAQDYAWNLRFPQSGTISPDEDGEVSASQTLAQATALGLDHVVVGRIALTEIEDGKTRMDTTLRVLNTASGKAQGEIHKELAMGDLTSHEAAIELAAFVIPQLDRQLRGSPESFSGTGGSVKPEEAGELVVQIKSSDAYADWLAVEKMLREHFENLQVKGIEIGPEGSLVRLLGVDSVGLKNLHGTRLSNGAQVQVSDLGAEGQGLKITLTRSELSPAEPKP
jgi:hypothetical protein